MPAKTEKQRKFFGAELARRREGKTPRVKNMSTSDVRDFAKRRRSRRSTSRRSR